MMMEIVLSYDDPVTGRRETKSHTDSRELLHDLVDEYVKKAREVERASISIKTVTQEHDRSDSEALEE